MSVYKPKGSPHYCYDFQRGGRRFCGATGCKSEREASAVEKKAIAAALAEIKASKFSATSLQLAHVVARYWDEVGQHHAGADNTLRDLERLQVYFTPTKLLTDIKDDDVAKLVAWRRDHTTRLKGKGLPDGECSTVTHATVNRSATEVLKKLFTRAKQAWGVRFEQEPRWRSHMLTEAPERVRELQGTEWAKLTAAMRPDYAPYFNFAHASGSRLTECLLRWSEVNWEQGRISKPGKGKKLVTVPITPTIRKILAPLMGNHPEFVFTYTVKSAKADKPKSRRPLTKAGVKTEWKRMRARAGVKDFRQHDLRHDLATKLLRATGNLKLVQRALNHADLKTTLRYAHVLDSEVATALENVSGKRKA